MNKIKIMVLVAIVAATISAGCVSQPQKETAPVPIPTTMAPPTPVPTEIVITTPTETPKQIPMTMKREIFENHGNEKYNSTSASYIYSGIFNNQSVEIYGTVYQILPSTTEQDYDGIIFEFIDFQTWGSIYRQADPISVRTLTSNINGTIRNGINVKIRGRVSENWRSGTGSYQPLIYAHFVEVIPERSE